MPNLINLLPEISAEQRKTSKDVWLLNVIAVSALLLVGAALVFLFAYKSLLTRQLTSTNDKIGQLRLTINQNSELTNLATFLDSKVKKLSPTLVKLDNRLDINRILALAPSDILVTNYSQTDKSTFAFSGTSTNTLSVQTFNDTLIKEASALYKDFIITSLIKDDKGSYNFTIGFRRR